ncbi:MAG: metallophosphoesterase [Candidatus Aenigmarchaeota archaeon]|nr:metallophosphoesterase [Candidatus Aenigmarchaeota archaeon]MDW8149773.1 metallophosphoesterase [Candidatus Aenigmarchaeota archaeon]
MKNFVFKLDKNIEIVYKSIFIKSLNAIVISDLQIGEELYLLKEMGLAIPQFQLKEMKNWLEKIAEYSKAKRLIINGDLKHEFGEASEQEWREVTDFINFSKKFFEEIIIVRGNHDNYLLNIVSKLPVKLYQPYYKEKNFLFSHGHLKIDVNKETKYLVIGHEEPSITVREKITKIKLPCLLFGNYNKKTKIICLPAFSPISSGSEVNLKKVDELLSPLLKESDFYNLEVYIIEKDIGIIKFPKLKFLL